MRARTRRAFLLTSAIFDPVHAPGTIEKYLPKDKHLGDLDVSTVPKEVLQEREAAAKEEEELSLIHI